MSWLSGKVSLVLALIAFLASVWYKSSLDYDLELKVRARMEVVLQSLLKDETFKAARPKRIAIGYGACQDLFVDAKDLLAETKAPEVPEHFQDIQNEEQLLKMFAYFFRHGAAAERFVSDDKVFEKLVAKAKSLPNHRWAIGGNAPVMALRFASEGADILLAGKMTEKAKSFLPKNVKLSSLTPVQKDDIHLILEYKRNEVWGQFTSPRANRFIVHGDINNPTVSSLEEFGELLKEFDPNLLLVSGLQMMDNYPFKEGERVKRLMKIQDQMKSQDFEKTRIHFEMASFVDETLFSDLVHRVVPYADSLGMNEQELPNLYSMLKYGNISYVADSNPRIAIVLDQMREVYRLLSESRLEEGKRPVTRMHIHTLAYQAILIAKDSHWKNSRVGAAKSSLTAHRHVCATTRVDLDKAFMLMDDSFAVSTRDGSKRIPFDEETPVSCWSEEKLKIEICLAPNLVCADAQQTAGGGDNISASGLLPQI